MFGLWERYVVPPLISCACSTKPIMKQREKIVPDAEGVVLEVGCGSGTNFDLYDQDKVKHLHAIEPAEGMVKRAKQAWTEGAYATPCDIHTCGAEAVPLDDNSVDTAVVTFVLCTIPDWESSLTELRRVLKPGGKVLFSEHGLAPDEGVAKWQRRIEPVWKRLAGGCHLTRDTKAMLEATGFAVDQHETMYLPNTPKFAGFAAWGSARVA
ncbi:MAG: class I SAM-dependent methyltransferase [Pseudomonadota bacterium]|nr:class I SAM-dependent methyltransferase [Pseudomonadota bacterium]